MNETTLWPWVARSADAHPSYWRSRRVKRFQRASVSLNALPCWSVISSFSNLSPSRMSSSSDSRSMYRCFWPRVSRYSGGLAMYT